MVNYLLMPLEAFSDWWTVNGPYTRPGTRCMLLRQGLPAYDAQMQPIRIMHPQPRMLVIQPEDGEYVPDFRELPGHGPEDVTVRPVPVLHEGGTYVSMVLQPCGDLQDRMMVADWREALGGVVFPQAMSQPVPPPPMQMPMPGQPGVFGMCSVEAQPVPAQQPQQMAAASQPDWDLLRHVCAIAAQ